MQLRILAILTTFIIGFTVVQCKPPEENTPIHNCQAVDDPTDTCERFVAIEGNITEPELNESDSESRVCSKIAGPFGGSRGDPFTELPDNCGAVVTKIVVYAKKYVDAIQVEYRLTSGVHFMGGKHGGTGGNEHIVYLDVDNGERIVSIFGYSKRLVDSLGFVTNMGRVFGPFGGPGGNPFNVDSCELRGILGASKKLVDNIGFYCTEP